ncbi:integrator complex subunit 4 [Loa loa]|uniref:Integrator complex subunit 4 n=2 Tax=Loa loa TaxID=7209 RepID=A0A1S0UKG0_LOALO|nr:integrator complex subunit 4 [Loa loa]EJD76202.1 integrator complex subunit 4 [Loa loa]
MQQERMSASKYSKDLQCRSLHRLKRERPGDTSQISKVMFPHEVTKVLAAISSSTVPPDSKRPRLHSVPSTQSEKMGLKLSGRIPHMVLEECLKCTENGDKLGVLSRLREFFGEHLSVLSADSQFYCAKLLIQIASSSRIVTITNTCLLYALHICKSADMKQNIWDEIVTLMADDKDKKETGVFHRPAVYASLLALFEWALSEGLKIGQYIQEMNCMAEESVRSTDQNNRIAAINLFVTCLLKSKEQCSIQEFLWLEKLLSTMAEDRDSRVRIAAVKGLSAMATSGRLLSFSLYQQVKNLCENSSKIVRKEALYILKAFADYRPEMEVIGRNGAKLRLVDDAFAAVCHAINDVEVTVRAIAARLLGDFKQVSDSFLDQTLDKKLLNAMRMSKTRDGASKKPQAYGSRRRRSQATSEWSTGKKLGEDAPVERFDEEQASIISSGACGAFVTALEDEFMIVRQAGVYSLGQLAADRPFLAAAALDHLADMFNDEIEQVRLDAVRALTPLVVHGILQKEQLDTILTVLDDALPDSREALCVLLSRSTLGTPDCLRYVVKALLNCMRRFPIDRQSIFKCMSDLGRRHATFVQLLSDELLELHPVFDITEPAVDDQFYLAKLILILNAASAHDPICSLLPAFAVRHYKFLRCSMPLLVPTIEAFSDDSTSSTNNLSINKKLAEAGERTRALLERTYEMMQEASQSRSYQQRMIEKRLLIKDMNALCEGDEGVAGTAQLLSYLLKILTQCELTVKILSCGDDLQTALNAADEGLRLLECVGSNFSSVDKVMLATLEEFRFQLSILRLAALFDMKPGAYTNAAQLVEAEMIRFRERCQSLVVSPSQSTTEVLIGIERLFAATQAKKFISGSSLTALFQSHAVLLQKKFTSLGSISIKWAEIVEPSETPNEPLRFVVGLPLGISINILLHNFSKNDIFQFRIKTDYPDRSSILFCPRESEFKEISAQTYRLLCKVLVQADNLWSDSARVRFGCVLKSQQFMDVIPPLGSGFTRSSCIPLAESPFSNKQAAMEVLIQPIQAKASC